MVAVPQTQKQHVLNKNIEKTARKSPEKTTVKVSDMLNI